MLLTIVLILVPIVQCLSSHALGHWVFQLNSDACHHGPCRLCCQQATRGCDVGRAVPPEEPARGIASGGPHRGSVTTPAVGAVFITPPLPYPQRDLTPRAVPTPEQQVAGRCVGWGKPEPSARARGAPLWRLPAALARSRRAPSAWAPPASASIAERGGRRSRRLRSAGRSAHM